MALAVAEGVLRERCRPWVPNGAPAEPNEALAVPNGVLGGRRAGGAKCSASRTKWSAGGTERSASRANWSGGGAKSSSRDSWSARGFSSIEVSIDRLLFKTKVREELYKSKCRPEAAGHIEMTFRSSWIGRIFVPEQLERSK